MVWQELGGMAGVGWHRRGWVAWEGMGGVGRIGWHGSGQFYWKSNYSQGLEF